MSRLNIDLSKRPSSYSQNEIKKLQEFRAKNGVDYRLCQNRRAMPVNSRKSRKVMVGITIDNDFLLFNVEYKWNGAIIKDIKESQRFHYRGYLEIYSTELKEINDEEPSTKDFLRYKDNFLNCDEFKRALIEADYFKYN